MWTEEKVKILKDLWGKGKTASQIAEIIGGVSRNAVIGKAHRLNLSAKINNKNVSVSYEKNLRLILKEGKKRLSRSRFKSLLIEKDFELKSKQLKIR